MYKNLDYAAQLNICQQCPPMLRFAHACPMHPDLLTFPQMITAEELYTGEQIAEMRELKVTVTNFRENLLMNENMSSLVMNLFLYSMYFYEISMIATQFFSACLPVLLTFALVCTRKPIVCRALIVLVAAKLSLYAISDHEMFQSKQKVYICTFEGTLAENSGVSKPCYMASVFFTYVCLSSLMSLSNFFSTNIILRLNFAFYTLLVGVGYLFALFLAQEHLM